VLSVVGEKGEEKRRRREKAEKSSLTGLGIQ
jgi:hypothetical protein